MLHVDSMSSADALHNLASFPSQTELSGVVHVACARSEKSKMRTVVREVRTRKWRGEEQKQISEVSLAVVAFVDEMEKAIGNEEETR